MHLTPLTPELYHELKAAHYKYLVAKRIKEMEDTLVYVPVKKLPEYFVIKCSAIDDETVVNDLFNDPERGALLIDVS